ncbi:LSU ribosomal protein L15P [Candidatus Kryptonium thompsonii]|uniref:Large ribosomal subunit protein uL15 n=1 Tax=Candidatus Kryptonium thompsonii TaxID=1633631 RepID=A0A0N7MR29_9BACT|nr:50S ribosomal protein L15 [Candidatus Kryptonium thompsoni]CUS76663.1 LSU ribosomal protein L15P [Candidatus Kryptonium thompsoni]CUS77825.1 LSU ribosomal protein L15P [Candidatus Kryptonium thompsoni]CUS78189.1 LSU ribosomal protein L15P [Candidatus Kryptonium thompsoni]CUS81560.1 LSU ribosomal protein L15P [Candidatus Kryptonium thompsoni]CUS83491.1 LSU ribosomal protein L15P [Candidatus Kryptonium thompsoni]
MPNILSNLKPAPGSRKKEKRVGRGQGSGHGGTSTRGHKGQKSRSGESIKPWFEGGQMPLIRRIPKRGFRNPFKVEYQIVNLGRLQELIDRGKISADTKVTPELLYEVGAVSKKALPVKILGDGELKVALEISAHAFSKSALQKIQAIGGKAIKL